MNPEVRAIPASEPRSVLIVEDSETTRRHMAYSLQKHGHRVREAADGRAALSVLANGPVDAIFLDLIMPTMDGWQFREAQLKDPELAQIPTIAVTVHPLPLHARYLMRLHSVVQKPFREEALIEALHGACRARRVVPVFTTADGAPLSWSRRGEVACPVHAPDRSSPRWRSEGWTELRVDAGSHRIRYQCQHCEGHGGPIQRDEAWALKFRHALRSEGEGPVNE